MLRMPEYIGRKVLIRELKDEIKECGDAHISDRPIAYGTILGLKGALSYAKALPSADVAEVKHGYWKGKPIAGFCTVRCSVCGMAFSENSGRWLYCPNCGAKMDLEEGAEE